MNIKINLSLNFHLHFLKYIIYVCVYYTFLRHTKLTNSSYYTLLHGSLEAWTRYAVVHDDTLYLPLVSNFLHFLTMRPKNNEVLIKNKPVKLNIIDKNMYLFNMFVKKHCSYFKIIVMCISFSIYHFYSKNFSYLYNCEYF